MSERRYSPVDPTTMLPLPVLPADAPKGEHQTWSDWHHPFFENRSIELSDEAGRVVRHARVERTERWLHDRFHHFYNSAVLPVDDHQKFRVGVFAVAGLLPEYGIDVSGSEPKEIKYNDLTRQRLRAQKMPEHKLCQSYNARRGIFFMHYAMQQGFDHIEQLEIEQFLETRNAQIKEKLGRAIVARSFELATEPIAPIYKSAQLKGYISPNMPKRPSSVILRGVIKGQQVNYLKEIENRIKLEIAA